MAAMLSEIQQSSFLYSYSKTNLIKEGLQSSVPSKVTSNWNNQLSSRWKLQKFQQLLAPALSTGQLKGKKPFPPEYDSCLANETKSQEDFVGNLDLLTLSSGKF